MIDIWFTRSPTTLYKACQQSWYIEISFTIKKVALFYLAQKQDKWSTISVYGYQDFQTKGKFELSL